MQMRVGSVTILECLPCASHSGGHSLHTLVFNSYWDTVGWVILLLGSRFINMETEAQKG